MALAFVAISCSVFEDRMECPCYLVVDYEAVNDDSVRPTREGRVHSLLYNPDCSENITHMSISCPDYDTIACTKGEAVFSAVYSPAVVPLRSEDRAIRYSVGYQVDSIYGCHEALSLTGEREDVKVALHKQFSTVNLIVRESDAVLRNSYVTVTGNTCGYDLADFAPVMGEFRYELTDFTSSVKSFRIPRQADYSLALHIENKTTGVVADFPVGRYIADIGYDFDVPDLTDFDVDVDIAYFTIGIKVLDWDAEYLYDVFDYDY